jgi:hypothetical protein
MAPKQKLASVQRLSSGSIATAIYMVPATRARSKRQRGIRSNGATEYQLHCAVIDTIRRWILPGWIYTHIASGEKRDRATAARLKGTGVVGGFPDLMFFGIKGEVCCVELNAESGRLSES